MSGKVLPRFLKAFLNGLFVFLTCVILNNQLTFGTHIPSVSIVSKEAFATVCVDSDLNIRNDNDSWTSSSGACDRRVCVSRSGDIIAYELKYDCNRPSEIFDKDNCRETSNSALTFPDCCPEVHCDSGTAVNDTTPACSDLSPSVACLFWKASTNCIDSVDNKIAHMYNLTVGYCRKSCGYCT